MDEELIKVVLIASLETVGLMEVFKKFVKFNKTWLYTLMLPLAFICFAYTSSFCYNSRKVLRTLHISNVLQKCTTSF